MKKLIVLLVLLLSIQISFSDGLPREQPLKIISHKPGIRQNGMAEAGISLFMDEASCLINPSLLGNDTDRFKTLAALYSLEPTITEYHQVWRNTFIICSQPFRTACGAFLISYSNYAHTVKDISLVSYSGETLPGVQNEKSINHQFSIAYGNSFAKRHQLGLLLQYDEYLMGVFGRTIVTKSFYGTFGYSTSFSKYISSAMLISDFPINQNTNVSNSRISMEMSLHNITISPHILLCAALNLSNSILLDINEMQIKSGVEFKLFDLLCIRSGYSYYQASGNNELPIGFGLSFKNIDFNAYFTAFNYNRLYGNLKLQHNKGFSISFFKLLNKQK